MKHGRVFYSLQKMPIQQATNNLTPTGNVDLGPSTSVALLGTPSSGRSTIFGRLQNTYRLKDLLFRATQEGRSESFHADLPYMYLHQYHARSLTCLSLKIDVRVNNLNEDGVYRVVGHGGDRELCVNEVRDCNRLKDVVRSLFMSDVVVIVLEKSSFEQYGEMVNELIKCSQVTGIKHVIVCLNKILKENVEELTGITRKKLVKHGVKKFDIIPTDGLSDYKITRKCDENIIPYKGHTLLDCIMSAPEFDQKSTTSKPLRIPLLKIHKVMGVGTVVDGRIQSGTIKPGDLVTLGQKQTGVMITSEVKSVERYWDDTYEGLPGVFVGIQVKGCSVSQVSKGFVLSHASKDTLLPALWFEAKVKIISTPKNGLRLSMIPTVYCQHERAVCKIEEIMSIIDRKTLEPIEGDTLVVKEGQFIHLRLLPRTMIMVERFTDNEKLGRIILGHNNKVIAAGMVTLVKHATNHWNN